MGNLRHSKLATHTAVEEKKKVNHGYALPERHLEKSSVNHRLDK